MKNIIMFVLSVIMLCAVSVTTAKATTQDEILMWAADNTDVDSSQDATLSAYNIYSSPTVTGTFSKIGTVATTLAKQVTTYTDTVTLPAANMSSQKCYDVTAVNAAGESGPSNVYCKTFFGPTVIPSNPSGLTGN
jgi:hypothetical protein